MVNERDIQYIETNKRTDDNGEKQLALFVNVDSTCRTNYATQNK
jgi:hypothetical protein